MNFSYVLLALAGVEWCEVVDSLAAISDEALENTVSMLLHLFRGKHPTEVDVLRDGHRSHSKWANL